MKDDGLVDPVEELGPECLFERGIHRLLERLVLVLANLVVRAEPEGLPPDARGAQVAGHDDDRVPEIDGSAVAVGQAPVLQDLEQDIENVGMGLLDLVEEHHPVRPAAHRLGELAALVVAHVARRGADEPRDGVLLHVLGHVDTDHVGLVVEHELGQGLRQLRLANARRAQEYEAADGPPRVAQSGAGTADGLGYCHHRLFLADQPLV